MFQVFLDFVYSHWVDDFKGVEMEVLLLADKYNVKDLLELAVEKLDEAMDLDNVLDIFDLSTRITERNAMLRKLRKTAIEFIWDNHDEVRALPQWNELDKESVS